MEDVKKTIQADRMHAHIVEKMEVMPKLTMELINNNSTIVTYTNESGNSPWNWSINNLDHCG